MNTPPPIPFPVKAPLVVHSIAVFSDSTGRTIIQKTVLNLNTCFPSMVSEYFAQDVLVLQVQNERGQVGQQQHPYEFRIPNAYSILEAFAGFDTHRKAGAAAEITKLKNAQLGKL